MDKPKIDDIVKQMKNDCDSHEGAMPWNWGSDPWGFTEKQAADAAKKLNGMNSEELAYAWTQLDYKSDNGYYNLKTSLFNKVPKEIRDDPNYANLLTAVQHDYPKPVIDAKQKAEADADKPVFGKHDPATGIPDFGKHIVLVTLQPPDGGSAQLAALVQDTQFTMQWDLDSLGLHTPKTAPPEFSPVLVGDQRSTTVDGWSDIRAAHEALKGKLDARQTDYNNQHKIATDATFDTEIKGKKLFTDLVGMVGEAQKILGTVLEGWSRDGDKLIKKIPHPHDDPTTEVWFERNTANNDLYKTPEADKDKFFLTPQAEQQYYVKPLKDLATRWDEKYAEAAKEFLKDAEKLPPPPDKPAPPHTPATPGPGPGPAATPGPGPGPDTTPTPGPTTPNTDYSALFNDALGAGPGGKTTADPSADPTNPATTPVDSTTTPTDTATNPAVDKIDAAIDRIEQGATATPAVYTPGTTAGANTGGYSGGNTGGSSGGGSGMDPSTLMMMMAMAQQNKNQDPGANQNDRDERRRRPEQNPSAPGSTTPGAPAAPGAPGQPTVTATPTTPPPAANGAKPLVDMTIPGLNGTQAVSPVIADAMNKEINNPNLCDARAAYDGTPGASTPGTPWKQVVAGELHTGDVVQWANHSALVVMTDNGPQIIINGQLGPVEDGHLVRFDPNNMPAGLRAEFGEFQGYFHPTGADLDTAGQVPPDTKPADPPKVSAPAAPGVVPATTPPTGPSGEI
ncbi:hypothetical protein [Nocardia sp. NPDC056000]|uniref:hypothetical protein n=1 Tax=Nocardia sp. NPDC056000 TaxID=3345674 RepID=UPI0035DCE275